MDRPVWSALADRQAELGPAASPLGPSFRHWRLSRDAGNVMWAVLDRADAKVNALSQAVLAELSELIGIVEERKPAGLVLRSAKSAGFSPGADVHMFVGLTDPEQIQQLLLQGHDVVDRLDALTLPTIAILHGDTMGGGLEIALACTWRIGVEGVKLGLPEVRLGLHPGLGGSARFPALIDPLEAMRAMLTGKTIHDRKAKKLGLIDALVPERHVRAAVQAALDGKLGQARHGLVDAMKETGPARRLAARQMRAAAQAKAPAEHYPAPYALIDNWEEHGGDLAKMKKAEIASFARLMTSDTAQNLIRAFLLREKLKKLAGEEKSGIAHVHVIGAGAMGGDIAAWAAWKGLGVSLADVDAAPIGEAMGRAADLYGKIAHGDMRSVRDALDRLIPDPQGYGLAKADLVIEAVPERAELKKKIYADAQARMKADAILATNTSSIPLEELRAGLSRPERLVGLHFFNPVSRMDLVEVVRHDSTGGDVERRARAFVREIGKLPTPAASAPGFIVNRALTPYLVEALILLDEGIAVETIDKAAKRFGMPVGPMELADQVGLDIAAAVADMLKRRLDWPLPDLPDWLRERIERGALGRKTGEGLYAWKGGQPVKAQDVPEPTAEMADRMVLPLLNTCVALLREGVTDDPDIIDAAMIFGTGFAPFRGGPIHFARAYGIDRIRFKLDGLARTHGDRFRPDPGWDALE